MKPEKWGAAERALVLAEPRRPDPPGETERLELPVLIRPADLVAMLADFAEFEAATLSADPGMICRKCIETSARSLAAARGYLPPVLVITP